MSTTASPLPTASTHTPRRVALASAIGTTIEWYDFYLYATATALVFNQLFFPSISPTAGTLAAFATYAAGLRRPPDRRGDLGSPRRPARTQGRPRRRAA